MAEEIAVYNSCKQRGLPRRKKKTRPIVRGGKEGEEEDRITQESGNRDASRTL